MQAVEGTQHMQTGEWGLSSKGSLWAESWLLMPLHELWTPQPFLLWPVELQSSFSQGQRDECSCLQSEALLLRPGNSLTGQDGPPPPTAPWLCEGQTWAVGLRTLVPYLKVGSMLKSQGREES